MPTIGPRTTGRRAAGRRSEVANPPRLLLIRHSLPTIDPTVPASRWGLSEAGRRRAVRLAEWLREHRPSLVVASPEPKAAETAALLAGALDVSWEEATGLEEHHRERVSFLPAPGAFEARVRALFERPEERVFGEESAAEARRRFEDGVGRVLRAHPLATVAVVSHGTVIALFAGARAGVDPAALWARIEMPSFLVFDGPGLELRGEVVGVNGPRPCRRSPGPDRQEPGS